MDYFYLITNPLKENTLPQAEMIMRYLTDHGKRCCMQASYRQSGSGKFRYTDPNQVPAEVDCVITLGGDGTLLNASRDLIDRNLPILGVNMGTLGYLCEIEAANVMPALDQLMRGDYYTEERMMIRGAVFREDSLLADGIALNDVVIARHGKLRIVDFSIYVNDTFLCSYPADGIILSTPTGSTGYTLSVGGPIVAPDASLLLLSFISPHTLTNRSIVLPDNVTVTVRIGGSKGRSDNSAGVSLDGENMAMLEDGGKIIVSRAEEKARFIKLKHTSFVEILREKLK